MTLTMTCDRCGVLIPHESHEVKVGGRVRLLFSGGRAIIFDLCQTCESIVRGDALTYIENWKAGRE